MTPILSDIFWYTFGKSPDGLFSFPFIGAGIREIFGLPPGDGMEDMALFHALAHPEDRSRIEKAIAASVREKSPFSIIFRALHPAQGERWIESSAMPEFKPDGGVLWHGVMLDVTEQKRMEELLKLKEFILDHAREAAYLIDSRLRFVYVNDEACRALGYSRNELIGLTPPDIDPDTTAEKARHLWAQMLADGQVTFQTRHRRRDGSLFPVEIRGSMFEYQGQVMSMSLARDITERKRAQAQMELLDRAINQSSDGVFITNDQIRFIYVNDAASRSLGYSREELLTMGPPDIDPDITREMVLEMIINSVFGCEVHIFESRHRTRDGRIFPVELSRCMLEHDGAILGLTVVRNITERKRMEEALRVRGEEFRALAENAPDPILRYAPDGRRLYVNPAVVRVSGKSAESLLEHSPQDAKLVPSAQADKILTCIRRVVETGKSDELEVMFGTPDGSTLFFHNRYVPEFGRNGEVASVLSISHDITERKLLDVRLVKREQEFRTLAENSPDMVVRYDRDGRFVYVNQKFERRLGRCLIDLRGKTPIQVPGLPEAAFFEQRVLEVVKSGVADEFEHRAQLADGKFVWGLVHIVPERDEAGRVEFVQVLTRDIGTLKEAERKLEESREQLRKLAMQWDSEQEEERKRLAWDVHEGMGQNLMALRMNLQSLAKEIGEGDRNMRVRAEKMLAMVDENVSLVRDVTLALRPSELDFGLIIALEWLAKEFSTRHGIACEINLPEADIPLSERGATVLFRVANEALSHLARRGGAKRVRVTLGQVNDVCRLVVREQGNSIDDALQVDKESFGLAWMQEQITSMGGAFEMFVQPGQGMVIEALMPMGGCFPGG